MGKNTKIVYSTTGVITKDRSDSESDTLKPNDQHLRVWRQRLGGGRMVTIIRGFIGNKSDMKELGKLMKSSCNSGGSVKNGEIMIQGDHREKIVNLLKTNGYNAKASGG